MMKENEKAPRGAETLAGMYLDSKGHPYELVMAVEWDEGEEPRGKYAVYHVGYCGRDEKLYRRDEYRPFPEYVDRVYGLYGARVWVATAYAADFTIPEDVEQHYGAASYEDVSDKLASYCSNCGGYFPVDDPCVHSLATRRRYVVLETARAALIVELDFLVNGDDALVGDPGTETGAFDDTKNADRVALLLRGIRDAERLMYGEGER